MRTRPAERDDSGIVLVLKKQQGSRSDGGNAEG
jgi:hypothetical protein